MATSKELAKRASPTLRATAEPVSSPVRPSPFGQGGGGVCVACGEVESIHILPQYLAAARDAEARGEGLVVAVQGIALRGSKCPECHGECLGHTWHHFIFRAAPLLEEESGA
jgi:hypothetical protein